jgi:hypothetical protein
MSVPLGTDAAQQPAAKTRRLRAAAAAAWIACELICAGALANLVADWSGPATNPGTLHLPRTLAWDLLPIVFAIPAALVISRQPRNPYGSRFDTLYTIRYTIY